jgi:CxxC-x17-CxxC domain-containing protein
MGKFNDRKKFGGNRGGFGGGGRPFVGGKKFGVGRDGGRPQMHKATCSECGKECELPFRPTGDRPVFCSTCFDKQGGGNERPNRFSRERRDRSERPRHEDRGGMHDAVCAKCGAKCQVPFRPTPGKEVLCDACFGKGGKSVRDNSELIAEIKGLHVKIDRLMKLLIPATPVKSLTSQDLPKAEFNGVKKSAKVKKETKKAKPRTERNSSTGVKATPKKVATKKKK